MKHTTTTTPATTTPATKLSDAFVPGFAVAVCNLYMRNTARGLTGKERTEALGGADHCLTYRAACYKARKACAAYAVAMASDDVAPDAVKAARDAFYCALRDAYAFSGARVNAVDGVKLPALFAVRMDTVKRVKVRADVLTADGASVDTYEKRRVAVAPSDAVWMAALENMAGSRLNGVDVAAMAARAYADLTDAPQTAAKKAPRPGDAPDAVALENMPSGMDAPADAVNTPAA